MPLPTMTDGDRDLLNSLLERVTPSYVLASIAGYCDHKARDVSLSLAPGKWKRAADRIMATAESVAVRDVSAR